MPLGKLVQPIESVGIPRRSNAEVQMDRVGQPGRNGAAHNGEYRREACPSGNAKNRIVIARAQIRGA